MDNTEHKFSCADCAVTNCDSQNKNYPSFCYTTNLPEEFIADAISTYDEDNNKEMMVAAAEVEFEFYCKNTRIEDTIEFAKKMGFKKIGIATCVGLISETRTLAKILRAHSFEVCGIGCKVGAYPKVKMGIDQKCEVVGKNICNPILQAKTLNTEKTDMNIIMGLCVGHDMLFTKYSEAPVTTLVAKDRVLGHNPVAALYNADSYYKRKLYPKQE